MSAPSSPTLMQGKDPAAAAEQALATTEIDASCRAPLLLFFGSSILWLILGTLLTLIASIKFHGPGFLADTAGLTLGRIRPAATNAVIYGFASQAAFGILIWLMCRLGRVALCCTAPFVIGGCFWNVGVAIGFFGILAGGSTGFEWLEMPRYASPILFASYAFIGVGAMIAFHNRRERSLYITQWYLLAALFWFPWIYSAANLLLVFSPVRGVVQAIVNAWFTNNLLGLWLTPVGLGAVFYFIPKLTGRPLYSHWLAIFGFWTMAFFTNWSGLTQLVGGPLPAWMTSVSIAASVMMLVPLICVALNWYWTMDGNCELFKTNMTLRFVMTGGMFYLLSSLLGIALGLRTVSVVTHFTYVHTAQTQMALQGFFAMVAFGSIYSIVPRLVQAEWPSTKMIRLHYNLTAIGVGLIALSLTIGGIIQGVRMNNPTVAFVDVNKSTIPFVGVATLGWLLLLVGQIIFLRNFLLLMRGCVEPFRKSTFSFLTGADAAQVEERS